MVSLRRLMRKAIRIGCSISKVNKCENKLEVEKLMKVIDDKIKTKLNPKEENNQNGSSK